MQNFLLLVHKLVSWLDGKKAMLTSIGLAISAYLSQKGVIAPDLNTLIASIAVILNGGALTVSGTQSYKDNKTLGKI
jgi:hypothetical protein